MTVLVVEVRYIWMASRSRMRILLPADITIKGRVMDTERDTYQEGGAVPGC